jgi:hypothetical protein
MDDFVLESPATLDEVQWWGAGGSPGADNFTVRLFTGSFESPTLIAEFNAGSAGGGGSTGYSLPLPGSELDVWAYNFQLQDPVALDGGTPYYLSVVNNTPGSTDWGWMLGTNGNGRFGTMTSDTGQWQEQPAADAGFQLSGTVVPEPATITLLVIGIAGYLVRRRRCGTGA